MALSLSLPPAASAQQPGDAPQPSQALQAESDARSAAQRQLTEALGRIAADGSDGIALSQAGRAALALGDPRAAVGFLARAEALMPRDPVVKAALGAAMVQMEDPQQAMRYFDAAIAAGGLDRSYLGDRGLAFDLMGDQARAQADYVVAAQSAPSAELTRRHAISLGISGQADQAVQMLAPLLRGQDRAAWRSRAMIVAMNGQPDEARRIASATMPGQLAEAIDPYWALMDRLTTAQLAAAAHFGRFPTYETVRAQPSRAEARRLAMAAPPGGAQQTNRSANQPSRIRDRSARSSRASRNRREPQLAVAGAAPAPAPTPAPAPAPVPAAAPTPTPTAASAPPPMNDALRPPLRTTLAQPDSAPTPAAPTPAPVSTPPPPLTPTPTPGPAPTPPSLMTPAPTPAPAPVRTAGLPPSQVAGPPDVEQGRPVQIASATPVQAPVQARVQTPVSNPSPAAPPPATNVLAGWSMADVVRSIEVPATEQAASPQALSLAEIQAIAAERRREQRAAAEAERARRQAEARQRQQAEAEARRRAEAEAAEREEAERRRANPARIWVQIATGSDLSALAFDCRRLTRQYSAQMQRQSCSTAPWGRTRRLVVGPFRNQAAAREWESAYKRAGGDAFIWSSDVGEEVTPVGGR